METKHRNAIVFVAALLLLAWFLRKRAAQVIQQGDVNVPGIDSSGGTAPIDFGSESPWFLPFMWPTPGIYPETVPFDTTVNVFVDNPALAGLNNQYIPIFGLVGMTGVQG